MDAVITEVVRVLLEARAPLWLVLAVVLLAAVVRVTLPKLKLPKLPPPVPTPVVDENGEQPPGTTVYTDPNREDLDTGGSG